MTLEQLKMLTMVADMGGLKAASTALHKTQPAISQGIKQLESQLNLVLFSRKGYRLELTEAGRQIYFRSQRLLNELKEIEQLALHLAQGIEASVTLALEGSFDLSRALPILECTQKKYPDTSIIIRQEYMSGALEALLQKKVDLAITHSTPYMLEAEDIEGVKLYEGNLVYVASPLLLKRYPKLKNVEQLRYEYQIVLQDSGQATQGKEMGVQDGQRRWYVNDFSSKKTLILSGMGWGRLPDYLIKNELKKNTLKKLVLEGIQNELKGEYFAIRRKGVKGPVARTLWEEFSQLQEESLPVNR